MRRWHVSVFIVLFVIGHCLGCESSGSSGGGGGDSDSDTDSDGDGDSDTDSDTDSDADSDGDSDTDSDTDSDGDTDGDSDADSDSDTDTNTGCADEDNDEWCADFDCNDTDSEINPDADEIASDGIDNDCDTLTDEKNDASVTCGGTEFEITIVPVRLMILQDVSGSMVNDKWTQAKAALNTMLTNPDNSEIEFGFDSFPNNGACGAGQPVQYDCGVETAADLATLIQGLPDPSGSTPLCVAMKNFNTDINAAYAQFFTDTDADSYLLIVSDGDDTCGGGNGCGNTFLGSNAVQLGNAATELLAKGISTYVIGFGVTSNKLDSIAANGGTSYTTAIPANDQTTLQNALNSIAASVASCTFDVQVPGGANNDDVNFYFDGADTYMNPDCADTNLDQNELSWTWVDPVAKDAVRFCEKACADLKSNPTVSAEFGCPPNVP